MATHSLHQLPISDEQLVWTADKLAIVSVPGYMVGRSPTLRVISLACNPTAWFIADCCTLPVLRLCYIRSHHEPQCQPICKLHKTSQYFDENLRYKQENLTLHDYSFHTNLQLIRQETQHSWGVSNMWLAVSR